MAQPSRKTSQAKLSGPASSPSALPPAPLTAASLSAPPPRTRQPRENSHKLFERIREILKTLRSVDVAQLGGPILQDIGITTPEEWLPTSEIGELIRDRIADEDGNIRPRYRAIADELHCIVGFRPPVLFLTTICRVAALDIFTDIATSALDS